MPTFKNNKTTQSKPITQINKYINKTKIVFYPQSTKIKYTQIYIYIIHIKDF